MSENTKIAVVTGANRGLGLETVRQLAKRGYRGILTGRDEKSAQDAAAELCNEGLEVSSLRLDVAVPRDVFSASKQIQEEFGRIDCLINNAGMMAAGPEERFSDSTLEVADIEHIQKVMEVNFYGALRMIQAMVPLLKNSGAGRIVNVSSGMGQLSEMGTGYAAYRFSKTCMNAMTRILAQELREHGIKVNSVCPGWVQTRMGGPNAKRSVPEGASGIVWAATLPADGPSGGFFRDGESIPW